jgi:hypothetical protein
VSVQQTYLELGGVHSVRVVSQCVILILYEVEKDSHHRHNPQWTQLSAQGRQASTWMYLA